MRRRDCPIAEQTVENVVGRGLRNPHWLEGPCKHLPPSLSARPSPCRTTARNEDSGGEPAHDVPLLEATWEIDAMIPPLFKSCERSPRFWTDLVFVTDAEIQRHGETVRTPYGCTSESYQIEWSLPAGFKLRWQLNAALDAELLLVTPAGSSLTLGWDDQAHGHPHVLRRNELERICRAIASTTDQLEFPQQQIDQLWRDALAGQMIASPAVAAPAKAPAWP